MPFGQVVPKGEELLSKYVRHRGRVTGPHSPDELALMFRRGSLGRAHEVSDDAVNWYPATSLDAIFKPRTGNATVPVVTQPQSTGDGVCYQLNGENFGPVQFVIVESMAINGTLPPDALVWTQSNRNALPAREHPLLNAVQWPGGVEEPAGAIGKKKQSGCAVALVIGAVLLVGGGVYLAIRLTPKSDDSTKPVITSPQVIPMPTPISPSAGDDKN